MTSPGDLTLKLYITSQARKILGLLYRRFYNNFSGNSLLQLYFSFVRPHLDYASAILWSPHLKKDKEALENVQKFACQMATRAWDSSSVDLLTFVNLSTLEHHRLMFSLCLLYRIIHKLCYFDEGVFNVSTSISHHGPHHLVLNQPFAHTNSYFSLLSHILFLFEINFALN